MKFIDSPSNDRFKSWKNLLSGKGIRKEEMFLVFGDKFIDETIQKYSSSCEGLILSPSSKDNPREYPYLPGNVMKYVLKTDLYQELDVFGTRTDILICKTPAIPKWNPSEPPKGMEILLPLGDPANLGAMLRSCQAFEASKIILLQEAAHPFHPKSIRAAATGLLKMPLFIGPSIRHINEIRDVWALDAGGTPINDFQWAKDIRLLVGEEGPGLPGNFPKARTLSIPISAECESLNATVAMSIVMSRYPF